MLWLLSFAVGHEIGRSNGTRYSFQNLPTLKPAEMYTLFACIFIYVLAVTNIFWLVWHPDVLTPTLFGRYMADMSYRGAVGFGGKSLIMAFITHYAFGSLTTSLGFCMFVYTSKKCTIIATLLLILVSIVLILTTPASYISGLWYGSLIFGAIALSIPAIYTIIERSQK